MTKKTGYVCMGVIFPAPYNEDAKFLEEKNFVASLIQGSDQNLRRKKYIHLSFVTAAKQNLSFPAQVCFTKPSPGAVCHPCKKMLTATVLLNPRVTIHYPCHTGHQCYRNNKNFMIETILHQYKSSLLLTIKISA